MAVTVYRFGLPPWVDLPPVVNEQLYLVHRLREDLVTMQHEHEERMAAVWSSYPGVAAAEKDRDAVEAEVERLAGIVVDERKRQATRAPKHPAVGELREAKAQLKQARQTCRDAKSAVRDDAKARFQALTEQLQAEEKQLYRQYCQEGIRPWVCRDCGANMHDDGCVGCGAPPQPRTLYWACYNDVLAHHRTAAKRVKNKRAQGQPAQLRHHRWEGSGALAVQLQRQSNDPPRSPQLLASGGGKWRNTLQIRHEPAVVRPRQQPDQPTHGTVRMRVGDQQVTLPLVVDCDMDPEADIAEARLVVRRVAGHRRCHLSVTAKLPDPEPVTAGVTVAVHCGWRREPDDAVRVATWRTDQPVTVPPQLQDVVRQDTDQTGVVVLPVAWRDRIAYYPTVQAKRDREIEKIRGELAAWLADDPNPRDDDPTPAQVGKWRASRRFVHLAWSWHHNLGPEPEPVTAQWISRRRMTQRLMSWRRWDRARWEEQEHGRRKALARRDDAWRRAAAWFTQIASAVVVDDTDLAALVRQLGTQETSIPTEVTQVAARQRVDAAPGSLREWVKAAATRDGVQVVTVPAKGLSAECYRCGHDRNDPTAAELVCAGCGRKYDRDTSATLHMLRRASVEVQNT